MNVKESCRASNYAVGQLLRGGLPTINMADALKAKMQLEHAEVTAGEGISPIGNLSAPVFELHYFPLPKLNAADQVDDALLGLQGPIWCQNDYKVYGIFNHPNALKCQIDRPTDLNLLSNVLRMRSMAQNNKFYGPWAFLHPECWKYTEDREATVRGCGLAYIIDIEGIACVVASAKLDLFDKMALIQLTPDVIRLIVCEDRVVPQIRIDFYQHVGIVIAQE